MKNLYKFKWNCGRSGMLEGLFVATESEVENAIGSEAYFGEVLGKHSEVYGEIRKGDIVKLDVSTELVEEVNKSLGDTWSGYNPLHYIKTYCDECGEGYTPEEWDCEYREELGRVLCYECLSELKNS